MDHEVIPAALLERFAVEVPIDVVFYLGPARRVEVVGADWESVGWVERVADGVKTG